MLTACASSDSKRVASAPADPVIVTRVETRMVCPAELMLGLDERPQPSADARIDGNAAGMAWLRAILFRLGLVEGRLADAGLECSAQEGPQ